MKIFIWKKIFSHLNPHCPFSFLLHAVVSWRKDLRLFNQSWKFQVKPWQGPACQELRFLPVSKEIYPALFFFFLRKKIFPLEFNFSSNNSVCSLLNTNAHLSPGDKEKLWAAQRMVAVLARPRGLDSHFLPQNRAPGKVAQRSGFSWAVAVPPPMALLAPSPTGWVSTFSWGRPIVLFRNTIACHGYGPGAWGGRGCAGTAAREGSEMAEGREKVLTCERAF